jgi:hypothetical protein
MSTMPGRAREDVNPPLMCVGEGELRVVFRRERVRADCKYSPRYGIEVGILTE